MKTYPSTPHVKDVYVFDKLLKAKSRAWKDAVKSFYNDEEARKILEN